MNITYDDLVEKQQSLNRKYSERVADLIEGAQKILEEYRESLVCHGENRGKIAFIGEFVQGKAEFVKLSEAHLNQDHQLKFTILTDLSVSEQRKSYVAVELTLSMSDGKILALVGQTATIPFIIPVDNSAYSYHQVCLAIKQTISNMLDDEMPR